MRKIKIKVNPEMTGWGESNIKYIWLYLGNMHNNSYFCSQL